MTGCAAPMPMPRPPAPRYGKRWSSAGKDASEMSDGQPSTLSNYVAAVEAENDLLRERVRQLEELLGLDVQVPLLFGLTPKEGELLNLLMSRDAVTKEAAIDQMYFDRPNEVP